VRLAARLQRELRGSDSVARLGGDEFGFLLEGLAPGEGLFGVAQRLLAAVAEPSGFGQPQLLTASLGITAAVASDTTETVLSNAEGAMSIAKKAGPGSVEIYDEAMRVRLLRDLALVRALAAALRNDQLEVHYQPIASLRDGRILALEALARWRHPEWGWVRPDEFIAVAEEHGLIVELGQRVLGEAAKHAAAWRASYPDALPLGTFVNASPRQLSRTDFVEVFTRALEEHGTTPGDIGIEITERVLIDHDEETLAANLDRLTRLGVRFGLDDFGTGYSSLTALKQLPLTVLKIDRSFVTAIRTATDPAPITRASISLGHALGLVVVAEGVETKLQADYLRRLGCDAAQGFHYHRPRSPRQTTALLQAQHDTTAHHAQRERRARAPAG
jgi:predicted signal transduction protein with EAL and GGDEF domain